MDQEATKAIIVSIVKRLIPAQVWADEASSRNNDLRPLSFARLREGRGAPEADARAESASDDAESAA